MTPIKLLWKMSKMKNKEILTPKELQELFDSVKLLNRFKKIFKTMWSLIMGICTIAAAVFSILAYFK